MSWHAAPAEAWQALGANRLRTALTMLSMIIGVGAVVLMLAVGGGARNAVNQAISAMGSASLVISSGSSSAGGLRGDSGTAPPLMLADVQAMNQLPALSAIAPVFPNGAQLAYGSGNWNTTVYGVTPEYLTVRAWKLAFVWRSPPRHFAAIPAGGAVTVWTGRNRWRRSGRRRRVAGQYAGGNDRGGDWRHHCAGVSVRCQHRRVLRLLSIPEGRNIWVRRSAAA